jgi:putative membrane protein
MEMEGMKRAAVLAIGAFALAACSRKDDTAADTTSATNSANTMAASDTGAASSTPTAPAGMSDANIFALLDAANAGDSTEGAIAATKGTSAQVREFGKQMMRDHHAMRLEGQALAKKLNVTPQPSSDDNSQADLQKNLDMLNSTAKGKDFDKAYIDLQVDDHKAVLDKATKAMAATQTAELKNLIQKAAPRVQAHLDKAQAIQKSMK